MSSLCHVICVSLVAAMLVTSCHGWFFARRYRLARASGRAVDAKCVAKAKVGACEFYECFEQRLPCGRKWYNERYGEPYCRDFEAYASTFSTKGQLFLNASQQCVTQELVTWYQRDGVDCHDYTHFAFKALSRCYMKHDFCAVIKTDGLNFVTLLRPQHLFDQGALKIWREILRIAFHCEPEKFQLLIGYFWESFSSKY